MTRGSLLRTAALGAALALAYFLAGRWGLSFAIFSSSTTPLWPPTGIALAALLLFGDRLWPGLLVGAFAVNLPIAWSPGTALVIAVGNTVEGVVAARLVRRFARGARAFERPRDMVAFALVAGLAAPTLSATVGATTLWLAGQIAPAGYAVVWLTWWLGDGAGALLFAPVLLLWALPRAYPVAGDRFLLLETFGALLATALVSQVVFGPLFPPRSPLTFAPFAVLLWPALRLGPRPVALALMIVTTIAVSGTMQGYGPFTQPGSDHALLFLHAFLGTAAVTSLAVAAAVAERRLITEEREALRLRTERERARLEAAYETQERLASIVEHSDDAIISQTLDGVITSWNRGAERLFGYLAPEALGRRPDALVIPPEGHAEEADVLARVRRGEDIDTFETVGVGKDGRRLDVSLTVSPIRNHAGLIVGLSKIARDVTAARLYQRERAVLLDRERTARAEAEAANQAKDSFLATLSHELRTPLSAILGWVQVIQMRQDAATLAQGLDSIDRNARLQTQLIEDLLDLSRITAGKVRLETEPVDLAAVLVAAVETVRPAAETKGLHLTLHLPGGPLVVAGDPARLQQIFGNLLSNAVKFTPADGQVAVELTRTASHVVVRVSDTGAGISLEALPHIFEPFHQADSSMSRSHGGLGLGLAIVRQLVELQQGTVTADSPGPGRGALFTVTFPLRALRPVAAPSADSATGVPGPRCDDLKVLLVEDEPDARIVLATFLQERGAQVTAAASVREALQLLAGDRFDVVVSDLAMPDLDGFDLAREVRQRTGDREGRTPLVALTAHAGDPTRARALAVGFDVHVTKPVDPDGLASVVAGLAHRSSG